MEQTFESETCAVFDEVLPPDHLREVFEFFRSVDFKLVHETRTNLPPSMQIGYKRSWRTDEGHALTGPGFSALATSVSDAPETTVTLMEHWASNHGVKFYPSGTSMDRFLGVLQEMAVQRLSTWIGEGGTDWIALTATPYVHPSGVGMSWHADDVLYTGAYSFFVHPAWDPDFGGEFCIYDDAVKTVATAPWANRLYDPLSDPVRMQQNAAATAGRFFQPVPNRLVVIKRGVMHKVNRVGGMAGSHARSSITGFFLDSHVASQVLR